MTIGERIKERRLEKKMSLDDLAKIAHVARQTIYKYENNIITNIPTDKIEAIAIALNVSPTYLMGWDKHKTPQWLSADIIATPEFRDIISKVADEVHKKYPNDNKVNVLISSFNNYLKHIDNLLETKKDDREIIAFPESIMKYYNLNDEGKSLVENYVNMIYENKKYRIPYPKVIMDELVMKLYENKNE